MSTEPSQINSFSPGLTRFLKPSHRTSPEQIVGLGIFLMLSFGHELLNGWLIGSSSHSSWYAGLIQAPWALAKETYGPICTVYYAVLSLSIWNLWRRYSLRNLKLEVSVFFAQFFFQIVWASSFFVLQETLLALVVLLLLCCNHLLSALLFWKKDSSSGGLLLLSFFWIFYVMGLNMVICISNP